MLIMSTNKLFCYWLQGYFEISQNTQLTAEKLTRIREKLAQVAEPLGPFTQWLDQLLDYFAGLNNTQSVVDYFTPHIFNSLNAVFAHVIDNSYDTEYSSEELQQIHDGLE